jgi:hypothetical protein
MASLVAKQSDQSHSARDLKAVDTDFRRKVRAQYQQGIAQIDAALDLIIARTRAQIDGSGEPISPTDVQHLLETAIAVYTAKCGPLDRSNAASLMMRAINRCLNTEKPARAPPRKAASH